MPKERKLYSISDYCTRHGIDKYEYFKELKKFPEYSERIQIDSKGDYVIDRTALIFIAEIVVDKANRKKTAGKSKSAVSAIASEMNFLVNERERLDAENKELKKENFKLRSIVEDKNIQKRKK